MEEKRLIYGFKEDRIDHLERLLEQSEGDGDSSPPKDSTDSVTGA